jgi:hypothetical protein
MKQHPRIAAARHAVPDAQPPSCMPIPNRNAPATTDAPNGDTVPIPSDGVSVLRRATERTPHVSASIHLRAQSAPRRAVMKLRHDG